MPVALASPQVETEDTYIYKFKNSQGKGQHSPAVVAHTFNSSTKEADKGGSGRYLLV